MTLRYITGFEEPMWRPDSNVAGFVPLSEATGWFRNNTGTYFPMATGRRAGTQALPGFGLSNTWTFHSPVLLGVPVATDVRGVAAGGDWCYIGFAFRTGANATDSSQGLPFFRILNHLGQRILSLHLSGGKLAIQNSSNLYIVSQTNDNYWVTANTWRYLEIGFLLNSAGDGTDVTLRVDGSVVASGVGLSVGGSKVVTFGGVEFYSEGNVGATDDFYVCDSLGTENNGFLGDCRVETLDISAAGTHQEWDNVNGPSQYASVSGTDVTDANYIRSTGSSLRSTFVVNNLAVTPTSVLAVQVHNSAIREGGTNQKLAGAVRVGGTTHISPVGTLPRSDRYGPAPGIFEINPATGVAWTASDVNGIEAGPVITV